MQSVEYVPTASTQNECFNFFAKVGILATQFMCSPLGTHDMLFPVQSEAPGPAFLPRETPRLFIDATFRAAHGVRGSRSSFCTARNAAPICRCRISCGARGRSFCCAAFQPFPNLVSSLQSEAFQSLPLAPKSKLCTPKPSLFQPLPSNLSL